MSENTNTNTSFLNDAGNRALIFQAVLLAVVVFVGYYLFSNLQANLETRGISTGFSFLNEPAGFPVLIHLIEYTEADTYGRAFAVALINTFVISLLGIILATVIGVIMGLARLSNNWLVARLATVYIETLRNIPLLLQMFFWYFAVLAAMPHPRNSIVFGDFFINKRGIYSPNPQFQDGSGFVLAAFLLSIVGAFFIVRWAKARQKATGNWFPAYWASFGTIIGVTLLAFVVTGFPVEFDLPSKSRFNVTGGMVLVPEFVAVLIALSTYTGSFIAEIVRAGILSVNWGQTEASRSLGLPDGKTQRLIVLPQALRVIIPPLTSQYLNLAKNSSLGAAIAYPELVAVVMGTTLNQTGQAIETIGLCMLVYGSLSLSISLFMNWYNKRMSLVER
ncbi:amino acid ABC transporter permease [Marinomonas mediterranea]|jgi:amino acid ABC transporter membrane protein 1, PAAT family (TC 3.A.1.3.-)|uniref:Polar amino acid ABC transporter, inner membrane subunit n=1 Tax=Marinomonas mediterranea (strain ATCC 700492 / JCM 21426 / NBRC 103028 / MMB-1) TaxID=717774 RepID=F2K0Y7_MARM1|nr:amino acid ABC transporter permease [Marinomonas mediterranea]ADZ93336.1 polar amino acid ABC transporter, inner membrane subunit [Marinomonas mediterranea MMB-1]WCN11225.1 ABC transporter permease subunit [Marinomonas mediterranea]WCN15287.1 ABC transporter permease subunit [Marinomonas mediterranea]WCN19332.1 ABC transporter permease subunit [Marinomonas mediterranea MMB-1]